jgi:type II secretory pathway predicted ATPase ExeA
MTLLAELLSAKGLRRKVLGEHLGLARSTMTHWLSHGRVPKRLDPNAVRAWLLSQGLSAEEIAGWDPENERAHAEAQAQSPLDRPRCEENDSMLLRAARMSEKTRRHFGLSRDPFGELDSAEDLYVSPDIRYVREALLTTAEHGGFMAVIGESGSGKSTLREDLLDRIARDQRPIDVVEPYVIGMEQVEARGTVLRVGHIASAIVRTLAPQESLRQDPDARVAQVHRVLRGRYEAGRRVVLVIEEAHAMPQPTLRHLKRLRELKQGFRSLLSVILIGQPELHLRLSESDPSVREVVQRVEIVTLDPLNDPAPYLSHRLRRIGVDLGQIAEPAAMEAIRSRLVIERRGRPGAERVSLLHPLAIGNLFSAAANLAAEVGAPKITADAVMEA